jgi:hypothetical protein
MWQLWTAGMAFYYQGAYLPNMIHWVCVWQSCTSLVFMQKCTKLVSQSCFSVLVRYLLDSYSLVLFQLLLSYVMSTGNEFLHIIFHLCNLDIERICWCVSAKEGCHPLFLIRNAWYHFSFWNFLWEDLLICFCNWKLCWGAVCVTYLLLCIYIWAGMGNILGCGNLLKKKLRIHGKLQISNLFSDLLQFCFTSTLVVMTCLQNEKMLSLMNITPGSCESW